MSFVPLRVRSHGSLLHGVASPETLIQRALVLGYRALALTDRNNLYVAIRFYSVARREGLTPLLGAELVTAEGSALLLPLDRRGYANLCRLLTDRHLDPDFDLAAALGQRSSGLHVIVESPGLAASLITAGVRPAAGHRSTGPPPPGHAPPGGLWFGIRGLASERPRLGERLAAARWLGIPPVATGDCLLLTAADHETHRVAATAAAGELLDRMPPSAFESREAVLVSGEEWARRVRAVCAAAGVPEVAPVALANNAALAERCRLEIELGMPIFPHAPVPQGESGRGYLQRLGRAGVERRYARGAARARREAAGARLDWELDLIERLGFTDYFLLVADIVEFARARAIPTVGRGSGAGSLVAYVLGITNVDPLAHGLYFERFLHPARRDCPDLDIDLCWRRRDEVIDHVYRTYGSERVAMISTQATLGARSAFREAARALGVPNARVNLLSRRVPRSLAHPYLDHLLAVPEARGVDWREPVLARALALAERLEGAPRHLSIHCGGVVIGDEPLTHYLPLERAAKGIVVTQFEMRAVEAIGLVKMDLLGNRALSTIGECVALAGTHRGVEIDVDTLPDPDPAAAARLMSGDTLNCFQLESPAMRGLLRMLQARTLDETIAAVALVRPGPAESGMKEAYCRRHRGLEAPSYLHPRLEPVLAATHGVMLYEEDVMRVASALTGIPLHEGDELRRAIGAARTDAERASLEHGFVRCAERQGVDEATASAVWRELARFGAYAFCKAHAAGYGALAYQSTYLKTHFAPEFAVGILNHHAGMYETWVHVEDLRRHGVTFLAPCVRRSTWDATLEVVTGDARAGAYPTDAAGTLRRPVPPTLSCVGSTASTRCSAIPGSADARRTHRRTAPAASAAAPAPAAQPAPGPPLVRVGLSRVTGLARATADRIIAERARRDFTSLADFTDRVRASLPELEALILAGAFDWTRRTRPSLLLEARAGATAWKRRVEPAPALVVPGGAMLATEARAPVAVPELPEFEPAERVQNELQATGLWFSAHPLEVWIEARGRHGATAAAQLPERVGRHVEVAGLPCARRRVQTRSGEMMLFLTLADRSGLAECVLFPAAYRRCVMATRGRVLRAQGRVDDTLGAVTLTTERIEVLA